MPRLQKEQRRPLPVKQVAASVVCDAVRKNGFPFPGKSARRLEISTSTAEFSKRLAENRSSVFEKTAFQERCASSRFNPSEPCP